MQHKISLTRINNTRTLVITNAAVAVPGIYPAHAAASNDVVNITTLKWVTLHAEPSVVKKVELSGIIRYSEAVPVAFLNKRSESIPVPEVTTFSWMLQLSSGTEYPRFIVFAFQTDRDGDQTTNNVSFDSAGLNVTHAYVIVNGTKYPYSKVGTDHAK